jgi:hypothetical protein
MRRIPAATAAFVLFLLTACASLMGPRQVDIPLYKLQDALNRHFPFNNRYLDLLDINIANPRFALRPDANRIVASFDALAAPPFIGKSWKGTFSISGGLRYDPSRNAIMLSEPRVENVDFNGLDPSYAHQIVKVGSFLVEEILKEVPLYVFQPDQLRFDGVNFIPSRIATSASGLVVTFEPVK